MAIHPCIAWQFAVFQQTAKKSAGNLNDIRMTVNTTKVPVSAFLNFMDMGFVAHLKLIMNPLLGTFP